MELETRDFGTIEIKENEIVEFPRGLPGFAEENKFVFLPVESDSPFIVMQSINKKELAFPTIEPGNFLKNYEFEISEKTEKMLKLEDISDVTVFNIVNMGKENQEVTVNLAAPVVVNLGEGLGRQVILDTDNFPVRYPLNRKKEEKVAE